MVVGAMLLAAYQPRSVELSRHVSRSRALMALQISTAANDNSGENERDDPAGDECMRFFARALPLMQNPAPHRAENDDAGHVKGPRDEVIFTHLRGTHGVKEKLEIPAGARQGTKEV